MPQELHRGRAEKNPRDVTQVAGPHNHKVVIISLLSSADFLPGSAEGKLRARVDAFCRRLGHETVEDCIRLAHPLVGSLRQLFLQQILNERRDRQR
jgi:hypothetical protein